MRDLVLLSGGIDSTTAMAYAHHRHSLAAAISVDYGQRHRRELDAAADVARHYGATWYLLDLTSWGEALPGSALTDRDVPVPHGHYAAPMMRATIVPNRNATFLMAAVGVAIAHGYDRVLTAIHAGDHAIYPDCRPEFIDAMNTAVAIGTETKVQIVAPFSWLTKTAVVAFGDGLDAPYHLTWSCYEGGDVHCGRCGTCTERIEAFRDAGVADPTVYDVATV
jgi:7-cyano-7-deazaguanine synthase